MSYRTRDGTYSQWRHGNYDATPVSEWNTFVIFSRELLAFVINNAVKRDEWWLWQLGYFLVVNILDFTLGIAGLLVIAAYSRKREFAADASHAHYLGKQTMIASLQKLQVIYSRSQECPTMNSRRSRWTTTNMALHLPHIRHWKVEFAISNNFKCAIYPHMSSMKNVEKNYAQTIRWST